MEERVLENPLTSEPTNRVQTATSDGRVLWIDIARALGILLVVFGHVERGLFSSGVLDGAIWPRVDFLIYTFHMALFFYLSGLNLKLPSENPSFLKQRAKALIIPYVVFSLLQGSMQLLASGQTNNEFSPESLGLIFIYPIAPFWFLYVLLIYTVVVSFWKLGWSILAVAVLMLAVSTMVAPTTPLLFKVLYFFVFFVVGAIFPPLRISMVAGLSILGIWLAFCIGALALGTSLTDYYALHMLPAAILGILGILFISQRVGGSGGPLQYIGKNVLAIYVMHIMAGAAMRILLLKLGIDHPVIHLVLGIGAGVCLPLAALWVFRRLGIAPYLGFSRA